jgi:hypothetical protein
MYEMEAVPWFKMEFPDDLSSDKSTPRTRFCSLTYEEGSDDGLCPFETGFIEFEDDGVRYHEGIAYQAFPDPAD